MRLDFVDSYILVLRRGVSLHFGKLHSLKYKIRTEMGGSCGTAFEIFSQVVFSEYVYRTFDGWN
jgi:hypothetical protein